MPAPKPSVPVTKRIIPAAPATSQPLTVDADKEVPAPAAPAPSPAPVEEQETKTELAKMAVPFIENADGSITVELEFPVDIAFFPLPGIKDNKLTQITIQRATLKRRRAACRRYPANPTGLDQDTCLVAELSGIPEPILDELDGRDFSLVQTALGKFLYSQRMS